MQYWIVSPVDVTWNIISDGRPSVAGHGPEVMSLPSSTAHLLLKKKAAAHNMQLLEWQIFDYDGRKTAIVFFSQCIILTLRPNKYVQKRRTFVEDSAPLLASFS